MNHLSNIVRPQSSRSTQMLFSCCQRISSRPFCFGTKACAEASMRCTVPVSESPISFTCSVNQKHEIDHTAASLCHMSKKPLHKTEYAQSCSTQQSKPNLVQKPTLCATAASLRTAHGSHSPESVKTFYRRELPEGLVSFTSLQGRKLFKESLNEGFAEGYFNLAGNFTVQSEPAYCGPSSLAMVLNALEVDPGRKWKGVWRWYSDELLKSCRAESDLKANGITFDEFLCLGSTHAQVIAKRGKTASREEFLRDIRYVAQRDDVFMVVSFYRPALNQTGDGHFSPVGAYHPDTNQVLVLDSARYKYPSWFCDVDRLYDALQHKDVETGLPRGYFLISRRDARMDPGLFPSFESQKNHYSQLESAIDIESSSEVVDLPERPSDVLPTKISCGKSSSCCSSKKTILNG